MGEGLKTVTYTNTCSLGNKQQEAELCMWHKTDVVAVMEMWWSNSHDLSAVMEVYNPLGMDRPSVWRSSLNVQSSSVGWVTDWLRLVGHDQRTGQ